MSKKTFLVAGLLCAYISMPAMEVEIGVDSLLTIVNEHNADIRAARSNYEAARQGISVARSARLPEISASLDLNYIGDGTIIDRDFTNSMRDKLPHFGNTLTVSLYQPVYAGGAINAGIDMAQEKANMAAIGVEQQQDASGIKAMSTFFNLNKMYNLRKVYVANIEVTQKLIDHMIAKLSQGTSLKNDITRYELRLSSLNFELQQIDNAISVLNNNLVTMLGMEPTTTVMPSINSNETPANESEDYWLNQTMAHSLDLKAIAQSRRLAQTQLRVNKAERLPSVGIVATDNLMGPITFEIPAINKNYNSWFVGVSVNYRLSSLWTTNKKERQTYSEIVHIDNQRQALSDNLMRRVHESYIAYVQAGQQLDTEEVNVRLANENYNVVETRFNNGMALLTDMLDASNAKLDAEIKLVNARNNILLSYYQLKYISGTLNK